MTNKLNGREVDVRINDRGPFIDGRVIDLSVRAARQIDLLGPGIAPVKLTQNGMLYKRDLTRFTGESVLQSPLEHGPAPLEAGLLALAWARAAGLIQFDDELHPLGWPEGWSSARRRSSCCGLRSTAMLDRSIGF